jgi:hypothetical protein
MTIRQLDLEALSVQRSSTHALTGRFVYFGGVLLPLAAILFEAATAVLTNFADPMPAISYVFLLLAVPVCNAAAWHGLQLDVLHRGRWFAAMTGFSAALALFYTVLLVPILPFALICLLVLLGILGFAPILSLCTAIRLMRAWAGFTGWKPIVSGGLAGVMALVLLAAPAIGLRAGAGMIESSYAWARETGYTVLRTAPVRQELLESCEWNDGTDARNALAWLTGRGPLAAVEARDLYYRVTGEAYDRAPIVRWRRRGWMQFDEQRGGDRVGRVSTDLQLTTSRLDGRLDPRGATAYLEWTMAFHNSGAGQQEARSEIELPTRGVVSRVTLWINGEEHEAAFGGSGQVRRAYQSVVVARRDPLLVTSTAPGRVLVQCFPVPPGGEMKIRLGITAPVIPEGVSDRGAVGMPVLVMQNFAANQPAWLWLESGNPLVANTGLLETTVRGGAHVLRGPIQPGHRMAVRVAGMRWPSTWMPDATEHGAHVVEQRFRDGVAVPPKRVVIVVDGSESTRGVREEVVAAVGTVPAGVEKRIILATRTGVAAFGPSTPWGGGVDAAPALEQALDDAGGVDGSAVVWIAGTQAVKMAGMERVRQALERAQGEIRLSVLASGGENVLLRELNGLPGVQSVPRAGSIAEDLRRFFANWQPGAREYIVERRAVPAGEMPGDALRGSSHVVRLWAAEEAGRLAESDRPRAAAVAAGHQIVTPWTGAVVLENAAQYRQNDLDPAKSGSTPAITPEPGTWVMIATGVCGLVIWRARSTRRAA